MRLSLISLLLKLLKFSLVLALYFLLVLSFLIYLLRFANKANNFYKGQLLFNNNNKVKV